MGITIDMFSECERLSERDSSIGSYTHGVMFSECLGLLFVSNLILWCVEAFCD